ncbi:hypothetical protein [Polaromonas sp. P5_D5]
MLLAGALNAYANPPQEWIRTSKADPALICSELQSSFPKKLSEAVALGKVKSQTVESAGEYCEPENSCEIRTLDFVGLNARLLVTKKSQDISVLTFKVNEPHWHFLRQVQIGETLSSVSQKFGVPISATMPSPIKLLGECAGLLLEHRSGRVMSIDVDCQACW